MLFNDDILVQHFYGTNEMITVIQMLTNATVKFDG